MRSGRERPGNSNANEQQTIPTLSGRESLPCDESPEIPGPNKTSRSLPLGPKQTRNIRFLGAYPKPEFKARNQNWRVRNEEGNGDAGGFRQWWRHSNKNADKTRKYQNISSGRVPIDSANTADGEKNETKSKRQTYVMGFKKPEEVANLTKDNIFADREKNETKLKRQTYAMGFKKLEEVANLTEDNILLMLLKNSEPFCLLLDKTDLSPNHICLILKVMKKLANSLFDQHKLKMLHMVTKNNFIKQLVMFLAQLPLQDKYDKQSANYFWNDPAGFFLDLYKLCEMILQVMPNTAINVLPKLLKAVLCDIPHLDISDDIRLLYEDLEVKILKMLEDMKTRKPKEEEEPPDNFRHINVFPQQFEIVTRDSPFLRENIVKGAYKSVEHYLDVQYRLVRNDFVKPLRDGICSYLDEDRKEKLQNIKVHKGVVFVKAEVCSNGDSGYLIQLPQKKNKGFQLKLENSRLFMYGSLVCFTKDNFGSIIFGRIVDRKVELLREGKLIVSLHSSAEKIKIDFNEHYIMIESKIYFEPYYCVLSALKQFHEDDFPMKEYIVDMQPNADVPNYYLENKKQTEKNDTLSILSRIQNENDEHEDDEHDKDEQKAKYNIPIISGTIHEDNWPTAEMLELNDTQYAAYKSALSRKFAIIQGPPGTGKTHVGLKVAKALITNADMWYKGESPMLVICFTNHALDQFLKGLLTTTEKIVRIGGQSKDTKLDMFNIKHVRNRSHNYFMGRYQQAAKEAGEALKRSYSLLEALRLFDGIIDMREFFEEMPELRHTWFFRRNNKEFVQWLLGGSVHKTIKESDRLYIYKYEDEEELFQDVFMMFEQENKHDIDDNIFGPVKSRERIYSTKFSDYEHSLNQISAEVQILSSLKERADPKKWRDLQSRYEETLLEYDYLKEALEWGKHMVNLQSPNHIFERLHNPQSMLPEDRWQLYFYWLKTYETQLLTLIPELEEEYQKVYQEYEEAKTVADVELLQDALVVGMTTTSAARLQLVLRSLRSRVVIVEEAAEIMEAHIVASLTKSCDHVILIGDHQQLRPSTADHLMETKYKLGISLFERMVGNKVHCNVLEVQHRMRPEISSLIVPTIYPVLHNHESVYNFPPVRGVHRNMYFIDHKNEEVLEKDESKYNMHEVEYLIHLAQYLILNGYNAEDITILCAYSAQMFKMFHERKNYPMLQNVRICVLDNFQGEESKIILLSLVRNNKEGKVGFLKIENRICVALSRAREGFYIMGNMDMLTEASPIWQEIKKTLESQDSLGAALPLRCQLHQSMVTLIKEVKDFKKVAEGGCDKICNELLLCGHNCKVQCHIRNRDHSELNCHEKCQRVLCSDEHVCPKLCFEKCGKCTFPMTRHLQCGHTDIYPCFDKQPTCQEIVSAQLQCGHEVTKRCHLNLLSIKCIQSCDTRIESCGHACEQLCHVKNDPDHLKYKCRKKCGRIRPKCTLNIDEHRCTKYCYEECGDCNVLVQKWRSCAHVYQMKCSVDVELMPCDRPCKKILPCRHKCLQKCSELCGNCMEKVEKVVPDCGHKITTLCKDVPTTKQCNGQCVLILPCGHQCQNKCKDPCTTNCQGMSQSIIPLACGHTADIPCSLNKEVLISSNTSLLKYCKVPCAKTLKCKHTCSGTCGECYQGRIHKVCTSTCGARLLCGHICDALCRKVCPPCNQHCEFGCPHFKCTKKCKELCNSCNRKCTRQCKHRACPKTCGEICSIPPCEQPCPNKLKCGHNCIGYCGDPCPTLCKVCDYQQFMEESYTSYEEDAKFVLLKDCGHIVEGRRMAGWLSSNNNEIGFKCCPKCKQMLINTVRYRDHIKTSWESVINVKNKYRQPFQKTLQDGRTYIMKLKELQKTNLNLVCPSFNRLCNTFSTQLEPVGNKKRQNLSKLTVEMTTAKVQMLQNISDLYNDIYQNTEVPSRECVEYLEYLFGRLTAERERMTEQEIDDYMVELKRLRRILQLSRIASWVQCGVEDITTNQSYIDIHEKVYFIGPYNVDEDENIERELKILCSSENILHNDDSELQDVVRVVGAKLGVWYKCPNNHICAVGDCGDTVVEYKCQECGALIARHDSASIADNMDFVVKI